MLRNNRDIVAKVVSIDKYTQVIFIFSIKYITSRYSELPDFCWMELDRNLIQFLTLILKFKEQKQDIHQES